MIRPMLSLDRLTFLEPAGKVGYRWGRDGAEQETGVMDYLEVIARVTSHIPDKGYPMICPKCGGRMKVVAFITEQAIVDRIIDHLKLTFAVAKPRPSHVFEQVVLLEAEESGDHF